MAVFIEVLSWEAYTRSEEEVYLGTYRIQVRERDTFYRNSRDHMGCPIL
jgi:hypothetical protein